MNRFGNRYSYVLNREGLQPATPKKKYYKQDLELMTTHQLREICRKEKIIQGVIDPMDKDDLIRVILRFRGADENLLIRTHNEEGLAALEKVIQTCHKQYFNELHLQCGAKIVAYQGLAIDAFDDLRLKFDPRFLGTNALVVGADKQICGIFNLETTQGGNGSLFLTKAAEIPCREFHIKNHTLYCFDRNDSAMLYRIYQGDYTYMPQNIKVYAIPLLDFEVRKPLELDMPLAIDFGTANTTAGVYLDSLYFEWAGDIASRLGFVENGINYVPFADTSKDGQSTKLFPSVVGVLSIEEDTPSYLFGYEAIRLANNSYIDEGFCVFYDIKRWIGDYEKMEEIIDRRGQRSFVKRKEIIRAYLREIIERAENRFKCSIKAIHISCPVKQKYLFRKLFTEIFPEYVVEDAELLDEGVSVIYNTISEMIERQSLKDGKEYKALLFDCGGGTTDLCSCTFKVFNRRVSYQIDIETAYENGDTDFGGNNLTFRIMQLLKIGLAARLLEEERKNSAPYNKKPEVELLEIKPFMELLKCFDTDVYRFVDEFGSGKLYEELDGEYAKAEAIVPTRFHDYENRGRADYYKVKNNFYFLFDLAERVKKEFFNKIGTLRVMLSTDLVQESDTTVLLVDKWKLTVNRGGELDIIKEFPKICFRIFDMHLLLRGDIYGIVHKFLEGMYKNGDLFDYSLIRLTGQSCKIDLFRSALKEYVPGKVVQFKRQTGDISDQVELKMACVDGTLKYLKDKKYGYADITVKSTTPALPYVISGYTHTGTEKILIESFNRDSRSGQISRNMDNLTLKLYLKDMDGAQRYSYTYRCALTEFQEMKYEAIFEKYGDKILQDDTDSIIDREVKFFVWAEQEKWGFMVVPVQQNQKTLLLGREEFFSFENDSWVKNFFDGTN